MGNNLLETIGELSGAIGGTSDSILRTSQKARQEVDAVARELAFDLRRYLRQDETPRTEPEPRQTIEPHLKTSPPSQNLSTCGHGILRMKSELLPSSMNITSTALTCIERSISHQTLIHNHTERPPVHCTCIGVAGGPILRRQHLRRNVVRCSNSGVCHLHEFCELQVVTQAMLCSLTSRLTFPVG